MGNLIFCLILISLLEFYNTQRIFLVKYAQLKIMSGGNTFLTGY